MVLSSIGESPVQYRRQDAETAAYQTRSLPRWWLGMAIVWLSSGCIADSYRYGAKREGSIDPMAKSSHVWPVTYGESSPRLDRLEKLIQMPRQAVREWSGKPPEDPAELMARRIESVAMSQEYLQVNGLDSVYIDVRVYDPREQWRRLKSNDAMHPIFRYTGGSLSWLRYTVVPRRVLRSDHFDPFTNTLSLNSSDPARAILEAAQVKEFYRDRWLGRGTYATLQYVPLVPLVHQARVAGDALTYAEHHLSGRYLDELYPMSYAQMGSTAVSESLSLVTLSPGTPFFTRPLLSGAGRLTGRMAGQWAVREREPKPVDEKTNSKGD